MNAVAEVESMVSERSLAKGTVILSVLILAVGLASATQLRNIESISPVSGQEVTIEGNVSLNNQHWIKGVKDPTSSSDLITKTFADSNYLNRDGTDTMAGNLDMNSNQIRGVDEMWVSKNNQLGTYEWAEGPSGQKADLKTRSIEIVDDDSDDWSTNPWIALHDWGGGGPRLRFNHSTDTIYLEEQQGRNDWTTFRVEGGNIDMNGNNVLNGAVCPDGSCSSGNEFFDGSGLHTTNIYDGSGGEIDIQSQINFNSNNVRNIKMTTALDMNSNNLNNVNVIDGSSDVTLRFDSSNSWIEVEDAGSSTREDIVVGRIYLNDNVGWFDGSGDDIQDNTIDDSEIQADIDITDLNGVRTNNLYDGDGGGRIEVQDDLDMNGNGFILPVGADEWS